MLIIEASYVKKLGLPGYSSHQYSLTLRAEISDVSQVSAKSQELHGLMQSCVDREIQQTGFLPNTNDNGNGHDGYRTGPTNGRGNGDIWSCSAKQKELILKIVDENRLDKTQIEQLARERFNTPVKALNKLQASGLIKELLEKYPSKNKTPQRTGTR
jgi:hypothetical protein